MRWRPVTPVWSSRRRAAGGFLLDVPLEARRQAALHPDDAARARRGPEELGDRAPVDRVARSGAMSWSGTRTKPRSATRGCGTSSASVRDHAVVEEQDVDVDGPRAVPLGRAPAHPGLDALDRVQERRRLERGDALHREVQEARLVGHVRGLRLVDRRDALDPDVAAEALERLRQVGLTVAQVGAEPEVHDGRGRHGRSAPRASPSASR